MSLANVPQAALYMSKVQFYSCLKLIAAHQSAIPLRQELIASTIALPLPKFSWKESPVQFPPRSETLNGKINDLNRWRSNSDHSPNLIELARADAQSDIANSDITSTDSEVEQNDTIEKKPHTVSNDTSFVFALSAIWRFCLLNTYFFAKPFIIYLFSIFFFSVFVFVVRLYGCSVELAHLMHGVRQAIHPHRQIA